VARIPYFDPGESSAEVLEQIEALPYLKHANLLRIVAQADSVFLYCLGFGGRLLTDMNLDVKLRELALLLVSTRAEADYVWIQHAAIARAVGVPDDQIAAVRAGELNAGCLNADEQAVLAFTAAVFDGPRVPEPTFTAVAAVLSPREIVELLLVVGHYFMLARVVTALEVEPDSPLGGAVIDEATTTIEGG
jgi:4-carboxymuconolactone decarboxylase